MPNVPSGVQGTQLGSAQPREDVLLLREVDLELALGAADSDIDVLVISDTVTYPDVYEALQGAEAALGRTINPTVMTPAQWRAKRSRSESFAAREAAQRRLFVIGSDDALGSTDGW